MYIRLMVFLLLGLLTTETFAERNLNQKRHFRTISVEEGLSQSTVYTIVQDKLGFIWVGTQDGLNRYDGDEFVVYRSQKNNPSSLKSTYIRSLLVDKKGVLWVGGNKGISVYNYKTETFKNYDLKVKSGEWFVTSIVQNDKGDIWISTSSGQLYLYNEKADNFQIFNIQLSNEHINNIWHIVANKNELLLGTDVGLFSFNLSDKKITSLKSTNNKIKVNHILVDGEIIWMGTEGDGLIKFNRSDKSTLTYNHIVGNLNSITDNDVRSIEKDSQGNLWVGTFKGLSIMNKGENNFQNYFHHSSIPYTISQNSVRYIYKDKQQGIWLGTFYGGLCYYHKDDIKFNLLNQNTGSLSLNDQVVNIIREDKNQNIWIGTNDKGLNFWDRKKGVIRYYSHQEANQNSIASNNIKAIEFDDLGNVLIGTHNAGLNYFNPNTGKVEVFQHSQNNGGSIAGNMVYALLKDHGNVFWVGTRSGLDKFDLKTKTFSHIYIDKNGQRLSSDEITYLHKDEKGRLWIGTTNGINIYNDNNLIFEVFEGTKLSNDVVTIISEDNKGRIWVGTRDGLNLFDEKTKTFTLREFNGAIKGIIYGIQPDNDGNIWVSSSRGLTRFNPETKKSELFDNKDGIQNSQFNLYAFEKAADGTLFFGGINGLTYFDPKAIIQKPLDLKITFNRLEVLNKPVFIGDNHEILTEHIDKQEVLKLKHDAKQFTIYFNTFNYISPNKVKYYYKLSGVDNEWQLCEDLPKATYANLRAGNYSLAVKAVGPLGETSKERIIRIKILPPWWKSDFFFLVSTLLIIGILYMGYKVFSERMRTIHQLKLERLQKEIANNKLNLERVEREKNESINKMKTDFFTNISHEFRTPLTLIISPLEELINNKVSERTLKKYHELILLNTKRLFHLVEQLLEFRKTESGTKKLQLSKGDIVSFVHDVYSSFVVLAEKNDVKYSFKSTENRVLFYFDKDAIEKVCFNLLSNAFKYTPKGGAIEIAISRKNDEVIITVSDTGIGIEEDEKDQIFERFYQVDGKEMNLGSGIGLAFTKKLIELHQGSISLESVKNEGSTFTVTIPCDNVTEEITEDKEEFAVVIENNLEDAEPTDELETIAGEEAKEHLLIIDDNHEIVDFLNSHFSRTFKTTVAYNGKEALEILEENTFDLIVSDVMMPEVDGIQVCKKIKQNINTCHIPVILLTAKNETQHQIKGLEAGADDYVTKPFSMSLLYAKVQSILKSRKRLKEFYSESKEIVPENIAFNTLDEDFLRQAIEIIEKHISDSDFSVDKFSKEIGMSRSNLYLKLKAITGESATDFVKRIRFKKAIELLQTKQYTVAQVAYMCGFNSPSYFSTAFKQYYDCMPTEYITRKSDG